MAVFEGQLDSPRGRFAIVAARFNGVITQKLVEGALATFSHHRVAEHDLDLFWVPGSFEIPVVARRLAASGRYSAVICLGCVVRGDTDHYQFVAGEAARGVAEAGRSTGVPVIFSVLTTDTVEQALQRASPDHNAGAEAVETAMRMANLIAQLPGPT
jgi:6,7-dimethyl-8-ribityllumazine synthase